jgi:MoxR-like ATPase
MPPPIARAARPSRLMRKSSSDVFDTPEALAAALAEQAYVADEGLSTAAFLALKLGKPLLIEGVPGVGKTEAAKALASSLGRKLIRLQCYEGIDAAHALYEWNYPKQLLAIRKEKSGSLDLYTDDYLIERPLLSALRAPENGVLLIDEIDRADHEFEALLLEFLSDFQISIPERGTVKAKAPPVVVLTSNRTRDLHEALRRRCVYHWINYPDRETEAKIVMLRAPQVAHAAAHAAVNAVQALRNLALVKRPGISEAVEWATAADLLQAQGASLDAALRRSIGVALKEEDDLALVRENLGGLIAESVR